MGVEKAKHRIRDEERAANSKHGGGNVMLWGCMVTSGMGELVFIDDKMDKYCYKSILQNNLQKSADNLGIGGDYYFQQDNDPKHIAEIHLTL